MASGQYLLKLLEKKMDQEYAKNTIIEQKNCPFFKVGSNQLTVYYTGRNLAYVDYTSVQSNQPARKEDFVYYYECRIDQKGQNQNDLCIGFADRDFPPNKMPGFTSKYGSSYGYMSSGTLYTGKHPVLANLPKFEKKDIIGCGINYFTKEIFFTVNGKLIAGIRCEEEEIREFYATVGLHGIQTQITFNFGKKEFLFNIKDYIEQEKKKGVSSVMEQELPVYQIHEIVHSYLYFQGYFDTLKEFESACQLNRDNVFLMKNDNPNRQINQNQFIEKINNNIQKICQTQQKQLEQNMNTGKNIDMELEINENKNQNFDQANSNQQNNIANNQQKKSIDIEEEESKQKNEEYQDIKIEENCQNGHNQQNIKSNQKGESNNSEQNENDQNIHNNVKIGESESQLKIEDFNNYQMTTIEETDLTQQQQQIKQEPTNTNNNIDSDTYNKETQQLIKNQQDCNQKNGSYTQKKGQNLNQKQQNEQECKKQSNEQFQQNKQNQQNNQHNGNSNNNTAKKEKNNNDKNKNTQINSNNHNMYFINEHNSNNKMPQNKQNNRYSNRKMTDDFSLVKERMRSDSFNQEFDMSHSFFKKDSIDFNFENSFNKEFSNNFSNIDQQAMNQMILGSQSNIFMGIDIQKKQNLDEVQENLIKINKDKMEKYRGQIRQMVIQGEIEKVIEYLNQYYPQILEQREDIKAILYYQNFLEKVGQDKLIEGIQFVQDNIQLLENKLFMIYDKKGHQQFVEFKKVLGVISFSDLNDPEIKQFFDKKQKFLISDLVNQAILCYMGYSERSVLELLIKQLILIQERFKDDNTGFGNVFQFSA